MLLLLLQVTEVRLLLQQVMECCCCCCRSQRAVAVAAGHRMLLLLLQVTGVLLAGLPQLKLEDQILQLRSRLCVPNEMRQLLLSWMRQHPDPGASTHWCQVQLLATLVLCWQVQLN